jgi:hypothetical protein
MENEIAIDISSMTLDEFLALKKKLEGDFPIVKVSVETLQPQLEKALRTLAPVMRDLDNERRARMRREPGSLKTEAQTKIPTRRERELEMTMAHDMEIARFLTAAIAWKTNSLPAPMAAEVAEINARRAAKK